MIICPLEQHRTNTPSDSDGSLRRKCLRKALKRTEYSYGFTPFSDEKLSLDDLADLRGNA